MKNPYEILGVSESATDDEINKAYKNLARKYHPDINKTPEAQEKMTEINCAYDDIKKMRENGQTFNSYSSYSNYSHANSSYNGYQQSTAGYSNGYSYNEEAIYEQIRQALNVGYTFIAFQLLNSISKRDDRWYYYASVMYYQNRDINNAKKMINQAINLNPNNQTYRQLAAQLENMKQTNTYYTRRGNSFFSLIARVIGGIFIFNLLLQILAWLLYNFR